MIDEGVGVLYKKTLYTESVRSLTDCTAISGKRAC